MVKEFKKLAKQDRSRCEVSTEIACWEVQKQKQLAIRAGVQTNKQKTVQKLKLFSEIHNFLL